MNKLTTTKCPSCSYEYFEGIVDTPTEVPIKSGKRKGEMRKGINSDWIRIGDAPFVQIKLLEDISFCSNQIEKEFTYLKACPKCDTVILNG